MALSRQVWQSGMSLQQEIVSGRDSAHGVSGLVISLFSVSWSDRSDTWKANFKSRKLFKETEVLMVFVEYCFIITAFQVFIFRLCIPQKLRGHWCPLQVTSGFRQYLPNEVHTESQNHRIVEVERYLWGSFVSVSLPNQGHLKQVAQDYEQSAVECLQAWRLHKMPGQSVPVLSPSQHKGAILEAQKEPLVFPFVPIDSGPVPGHHWKGPGSIFFASSFSLSLLVSGLYGPRLSS